MKAVHPLDQGGVTDYEKERIRKARGLALAAMPSAVSTFSVPTTALLKAGLFEKKKTRAVKAVEMRPFTMPESLGPGYGAMDSARLAAVVGAYVAPPTPQGAASFTTPFAPSYTKQPEPTVGTASTIAPGTPAPGQPGYVPTGPHYEPPPPTPGQAGYVPTGPRYAPEPTPKPGRPGYVPTGPRA